jgi:hypothetical protein
MWLVPIAVLNHSIAAMCEAHAWRRASESSDMLRQGTAGKNMKLNWLISPEIRTGQFNITDSF